MPFLREYVECRGCEKLFGYGDELEKECWEYLLNIRYLHEFREELALLNRLEAVFQKNPEAREVRAPFEILLESEAPEIQSRLMSGEPMDSIPLPEGSRPELETVLQWTNGDEGLASLILGSSFNFEVRRTWIKEQVSEYQSAVSNSSIVECLCPNCGLSQLGYIQ